MAKKIKRQGRDGGKRKPVNAARPEAKKARNKAEVRRIQRIKRLIREGKYESPEKWDIAIERMLGDLSEDEDEVSPSIREDDTSGE